jgi:hypothetical protein
MSNLQSFQLTHTGLISIDSDVPWAATVSTVDLSYNLQLLEIPEFAFRRAVGLTSLLLWSMGAMTFRENAFFLTSAHMPSMDFYFYGDESDFVIEENAFGNVDGGELWGRLNLQIPDFPELAFRLMLKSHFDRGSQSESTISLYVEYVGMVSFQLLTWG